MTAIALRQSLERATQQGRTVQFWLRDDDAVAPSPALDRLLGLTDRHSAPLTLAVIPEETGLPLADLLSRFPLADVAVHGWSHRNYAGAGEKKQELGAHRPVGTVTGELAAGFEKLSDLHGGRFVPMLVPPWNRIAPGVVEALPELGFTALSTFGPETPGPLAMLNTHVDLIDWHGSRGGRPLETLMGEVAALIEADETPAAIGILGHHLVHDDAAWDFLDTLFSMTADHPACAWQSARQILTAR